MPSSKKQLLPPAVNLFYDYLNQLDERSVELKKKKGRNGQETLKEGMNQVWIESDPLSNSKGLPS